ncbi:siderophore-interacting protein [Mumia zhuanghuii]|uniref:Siderophore-interacting protein n=1 Tax=Mumia zhuanghuii TaxID=2585211 RepID=A0A5Q6S0W6_9ACTN|nr:siderophore-interacting protein [Mumia zhuanghuii]
MDSTRVEARTPGLLTLHVVGRRQISPSYVRVTLGGGDVADFVPLGYDQWFRLFLPVSDTSLARVPKKLTTLSYLKFLTVSKTERPVLRNYTVRAYRADGVDGPEIDVDFVVHGSAEDGTAGPAASWAQSCNPGDAVALLDEGLCFNPAAGTSRVLIAADETGLPAVAGILASLDATAVGHAVVEVPSDADRQDLEAPAGIEVAWVVRDDPSAVPGQAALRAVEALTLPDEPAYAWVVGESSLVAGARRHWVQAGVPKENITFVGYWKAGKAH